MIVDEFGNQFTGMYFVDSDFNRFSYFSLGLYCEKYLNEGYRNMNLDEIEIMLTNNGTLKKVRL